MKELNLNNVDIVMSAGSPAQFPRDGRAQIAFSGRSNAGKSSMLNRLLNRKKLARVSAEPGKTITVNFYLVDEQFYLVDLPGYGFAKRSAAEREAWSRVTDAYFKDNAELRLAVQLCDIRHEPTGEDRMMVDFLRKAGIPFVVAAAKADKLTKSKAEAAAGDIRAALSLTDKEPLVVFSAENGTGRDALFGAILAAADARTSPDGA